MENTQPSTSTLPNLSTPSSIPDPQSHQQAPPSQQPPSQVSPPSVESNVSLEGIIHQITSSNNIPLLNHNLNTFAPRDAREMILSSLLPGNMDPLDVLDVRRNTLGVLYILSSRIYSNTVGPPRPEYIRTFCSDFDPEQARLAPERVTLLAYGIQNIANICGDPAFAIQPLRDLLVRFVPDLSYLTPIHGLFVTSCVTSKYFTAALPILRVPILQVDTSLCPDLRYTDNLVYHYAGGVALGALKLWSEAAEFFEICVGAPAQAPSAVQLEAGKKLVLVQLIQDGKLSPLPKYTNASLQRILKSTPYYGLVKHYPLQFAQLRGMVEREMEGFTHDGNMGLVEQLLDRAPRWVIKKLTSTYSTLSLGEIAKEVAMGGREEVVRDLILTMIEEGEINASVSIDGTVAFHDEDDAVTGAKRLLSKGEVDVALREAQKQAELLRTLEREIGKSRDFLSKAAKHKDEWPTTTVPEEDIMFSASDAAATWADTP